MHIGYRNATYNPKDQTCEVYTWSEEGERISFTTRFSPYFFVEDAKGEETSIYNTKLRKKHFNTSYDKNSYLKETGIRRVYENFGPVQQCLLDLYWKTNEHEDFSKFPLKIYYIDIEAVADTFPDPSTAQHAINVITIFDSIGGKFHSWGLKPYTTKADNVIYSYCKSEVQLLTEFIEFFKKDPCDILSGWNCIEENQHVWLSDRFVKIKDLANFKDVTLKKHGINIKRWEYTGDKEEYELRSDHGHKILASKDHKFMVYAKPRGAYKDLNTLTKKLHELSVEEIMNRQANEDFFIVRTMSKNTNADLTYGDMLADLNIDKSCIVRENDNEIVFNFTKTKRLCDNFTVNKNEVVSPDILQLMGFIFTDGTCDKKTLNFRYTNKHEETVSSYTNIFNKEHNKNLSLSLHYTAEFNGFESEGYGKQLGYNTKLGVLSSLIYNNEIEKQSNVELLSRLSYRQFMAFLSGLIDGDGCIGQRNISICNYDCVKYDFLQHLSELLAWNGVQSYVQPNNIAIPANQINKEHISNLRIFHPERSKKLQSLRYGKKKNTISKLISWMHRDDECIIRLLPIKKTGRTVRMYDIETESHTFLCNGFWTHNCANFDIPYIINRIKNILGDAAVNQLSPVNRVYARTFMGKFGKEQVNFHIDGISCVDYLDIYKRFSFTNRESYKLDHIGELELGEKKIDYGERDLLDLMKEDWNLFVDYNIQDVNLLVKLEQKLQYNNLLRMIAYVGLTTFEGAMGTLSVITGSLAIRARCKGQRVSTFIREEDDGSKNPGAYVAEPLRGFQESIVSFDANSLYPNVMISLNMSPETKVGKIVESDDESFTIRHVNGQLFKLTKDKFAKFVKKEEIAISRAKVLFSQKVKGVVPDMVDHYYQKRKEVQAEQEKCELELVEIEKQLTHL